MNFARVGRVFAPAVAVALLLTGCAVNEAPGYRPDGDVRSQSPGETANGASSGAVPGDLSGTLNGAGASSQASAQEAWITAVQIPNPRVTINYDPTGSGAGRKTFINGGAAFAGSDSALTDEELAGKFVACAPGSKAIDLPVYISPIAIVYNIDGVTELRLDAVTVAKIFAEDIRTWDDPAISALNPQQKMPALPITAVHRSDDSGTTKNFADYLSKTAADVWDAPVSDTFPYPSGEGAQGTSGVIDTVRNGVGTIGYADASRAGGLGIAQLKVGDDFVGYSAEAAAAIVDASPLVAGRDRNDVAVELDRTSRAAGVYPLVLVSYLIACQAYADPDQASLVKAYLGYVASDAGQAAAAELAGSAPISAAMSARVRAAIDSIE